MKWLLHPVFAVRVSLNAPCSSAVFFTLSVISSVFEKNRRLEIFGDQRLQLNAARLEGDDSLSNLGGSWHDFLS